MKKTLHIVNSLFGRRIARQTHQHLASLASKQAKANQSRASSLLQELAAQDGSKVDLGRAESGQTVSLPLEHLARAHSLITGGTGSGKSMAALILIQALIEASSSAAPNSKPSSLGFGVLDAKGELFERSLYLLSKHLQKLPTQAAEALRQQIAIVDLSSRDPINSYNIAKPWADDDLDFFTYNRLETLNELLPSGEGLSVRGSGVVKYILKLLAACRVPFGQIDLVLSDEVFRAQLLKEAKDSELDDYFAQHFARESKATIGAVRSRIVSTLLSTESLKLALSGHTLPDLRAAQDDGKIILIKCGGANIPRLAARTLQSLFLSDIRQAIFARQKPQNTFLWFCDEAQEFFRTQQLRDNMAEILAKSRSFGSFLCLITQNLSTAVRDVEMKDILHTNFRWSLSLRGTANDCQFLLPALPATGRSQKPRSNPYAPAEFYSPKEERAAMLEAIAHLPDREGYLWLKAWTGEAIKLKTATLDIPTSSAFTKTVELLRADPGVGNRIARTDYLKALAQAQAPKQAKQKTQQDALEHLKLNYQIQQEVK